MGGYSTANPPPSPACPAHLTSHPTRPQIESIARSRAGSYSSRSMASFADPPRVRRRSFRGLARTESAGMNVIGARRACLRYAMQSLAVRSVSTTTESMSLPSTTARARL